jgi:hypothetical protein
VVRALEMFRLFLVAFNARLATYKVGNAVG